MKRHDAKQSWLPSLLLGTTALTLTTGLALAGDADCVLVDGGLPATCAPADAGVAVRMPAGANTERDRSIARAPEGFVLSIDGETIVGDRQTEDRIRAADLALEAADVQVRFDGLELRKRLDVEVAPTGPLSVRLHGRTNYPDLVVRAEMRIIDMAVPGGGKTLAAVPVAANGQVQLDLPGEGDLHVVHRVYDQAGRYDETRPVPLPGSGIATLAGPGPGAGIEEGSDRLAIDRIALRGGAVTVSGRSVAPGARVQVLGETITPDPSGNFVLQRILPPGTHDISVAVVGGQHPIAISREIDIPASEWFHVGVADLTLGRRTTEGSDTQGYAHGRLSGYLKGHTAEGYTVTASVDSREEDLDDIFSMLDEKDPRSLLRRMDPAEFYPVYGDGSTWREDAPTSGRFHLRVEKDGNYLMWGDGKSAIAGSQYLRNERTLYGLTGEWASQETTRRGEPRLVVSGYAAQPDNLPQRDVFRGTGGSVYFLSHQDISRGSETVVVELRDRGTGRVVSHQTLTYGSDYTINYIQGLVSLAEPLSSRVSEGVVITDPGGDYDVNLIVQYEYTPVAGQLEGYSTGARAEGWVSDDLRLGLTLQNETTGAADQKSRGMDLHYRLGERSHVEMEYAHSDGPGFDSSYSHDGGLVIRTGPALAGTGAARRIETLLDLREMGLAMDGSFTAYGERRSAGFSTLDYSSPHDEDLWGFALDVTPSQRLRWVIYDDRYRSDDGRRTRESGAELAYTPNARDTYSIGIERVDRASPAETGKRTDVALRYDRQVSDDLSWFVLGQASAASQGLRRNHRLGLGGRYGFSDTWSIEGELSDGSLGAGGRVLLSQTDGESKARWFGYEFDPDSTLAGVSGEGRAHGRFVIGTREKITPSLSLTGESRYDLLGQARTLNNAYGVEYQSSDSLTYAASFETARLADDEADSDLDRWALSLGMRYEDQKLAASSRIELRQDRGMLGGTRRDGRSIALISKVRYDLDESQRLLFSFDGVDTDTDEGSLPDSTYADLVIGYARRPVADDRLNILAKYRLLHDTYGQELDGTQTRGPRQISHVLSLDADYDLNEHWSLGGKLGYRISKSADVGSQIYQDNDAWLAVLNARYHVVHAWDLLFELRHLELIQARTGETGALLAAYRHFGNNFKLGVGYNFGAFSDDLTDLTLDDRGVFINLIAKF